MAWTAPRTWVTGEVVTAALMNTHLRDNLLETSAATATTAGDLVYADAANSMGSRLAIGAAGTLLASTGSAPVWRSTGQLIGSASYVSGVSSSPTTAADFNDAGSWNGVTVAVTITTGTSALVHFGARLVSADTAGVVMSLSYRISGATTQAALVSSSTTSESSAANDQNSPGRSHVPALTAGSNTFTLQGWTNNAAAVATVAYPFIIVEAR